MSNHLKPYHFKPGQSGNPTGRAKLPPEIRAARKQGMVDLIKLIAKHFGMTKEEAKAHKEKPGLTQLELALGNFVSRAIKGDVSAFRYLVEVMIGKIPESDFDDFTEEELLLLNRIKTVMAEKASDESRQDH